MATFADADSNEYHHQRHHTRRTSGQDTCHYRHLTKEEMRKHPFEQRVAYAGTRHVFYKTRRFQDVNLVALARMSLYTLQKELLDQFATITRKKPMAMDPEIASNVRRLLHEYCML